MFGPKSVRQKEYADALKNGLGLADGKNERRIFTVALVNI